VTSQKSQLVELNDIDQMFNALEEESKGGQRTFMQTLVNLGMIGVIIFSWFIWIKLKSYEKTYG
jgi:hypothetical protein